LQLPQITQFYRKLGFDAIGYRLVQDYNYGGDGPREEPVELSEQEKNELVANIEQSTVRDASLDNFAKVIQRQAKAATRPQTTSHCFNATDGHFACVDAWGNVFLGNPEIGDERFKIGNVNQESWDQIWKGEEHYNVLSLMDQMQQQGTCANELCRHVRANAGVDNYLSGIMGRQDRATVMSSLGAFL
jgi:sulfatase maturation enzyme AslB (radical SAM superfamily)